MNKQDVDLGFGHTTLPPGTHICQIYNDEDERNEALLKFLSKGIELRERAACFSNDITWELLEHYLEGDKISLKELERSTALLLQRTSDVYYKDERFDPDRMLALLSEFYQGADEKGFHGARVIGEMTADIGRIEGGERLLEYESRVSMLLREKPITTVCQYNAAEFDGAMIMDVLKVHPMMVVRGSVIHNPFFIPPEEFLSQHNLVE